jgi:hypothetical protein
VTYDSNALNASIATVPRWRGLGGGHSVKTFQISRMLEIPSQAGNDEMETLRYLNQTPRFKFQIFIDRVNT